MSTGGAKADMRSKADDGKIAKSASKYQNNIIKKKGKREMSGIV